MLRTFALLFSAAIAGACGDGSSSELCYDYSCGGGPATGHRCFDSQDAYCTAVCGETDTCAVSDCANNCD